MSSVFNFKEALLPSLKPAMTGQVLILPLNGLVFYFPVSLLRMNVVTSRALLAGSGISLAQGT